MLQMTQDENTNMQNRHRHAPRRARIRTRRLICTWPQRSSDPVVHIGARGVWQFSIHTFGVHSVLFLVELLHHGTDRYYKEVGVVQLGRIWRHGRIDDLSQSRMEEPLRLEWVSLPAE